MTHPAAIMAADETSLAAVVPASLDAAVTAQLKWFSR